MTTTSKGWNPDHSINLLFGVAIVRRCCRCVCHSILRQNKQQGISLQKYTLFRKKGIIWMMKYSPVKCFKICHILGILKLNSLTNEMKTNKNSLCINLLFLKCEESGYFFRGCFAEKRDFCYAAEFATQFIKLICCEKKKSLDEIKALEDYVLLFIFCKLSAHYPALASAILQEL